MARGRTQRAGGSRPPRDAPFPTRSTSCRKAAIDEWVAIAARRGIEAVPAAPLASRGLSILWAQGAGQTLLDQGLDFVETTLERHKATIVRHVAQKSWRWIPKWVDDMIAAKVINGLTETLREMRDPDHPWREQANALVEKLIDDLAHDPEMRAQGEALKQEILANPVFAEQAQALREELETALRDDLPRHAEAIVGWLATSAGALGRWLEEDPLRRARINRRLRLLALRTVLPRRAEIGGYIAAVVDNWDTATLVNRLELQVGKDLQYIRINGTLVGGLVGLLIFTLSRALADEPTAPSGCVAARPPGSRSRETSSRSRRSCRARRPAPRARRLRSSRGVTSKVASQRRSPALNGRGKPAQSPKSTICSDPPGATTSSAWASASRQGGIIDKAYEIITRSKLAQPNSLCGSNAVASAWAKDDARGEPGARGRRGRGRQHFPRYVETEQPRLGIGLRQL